MARALTWHASVVLFAAVLAFLAGCTGPVAPSPRTVGLHLENRMANAVVFSRTLILLGTPPPADPDDQLLFSCGGHLDAEIRAATSDLPSLAILLMDPSGDLDQALAAAGNDPELLPSGVLQNLAIMWSRGDIDVESWLTITPDEVIQSTEAPAAPSSGSSCSPWSYTPEPLPT